MPHAIEFVAVYCFSTRLALTDTSVTTTGAQVVASGSLLRVHAIDRRSLKTITHRGSTMHPRSSPSRTLMLCALLQTSVAVSSGCATVSTIQRADEHTVKIFSGTRQDLRAIGGETAQNAHYRAPPPPYPLLDLPFSFALDVLVLPLTLPAAVSLTWGR